MSEEKVKALNPEYELWLKCYAMFAYDPNVTVFHYTDIHAINFSVSYKPLADLFRALFPDEADYSTFKIKFLVNGEKRTGEEPLFKSTDFKTLLETNPHFSREAIQPNPFDDEINKLFILFKKEVVQMPYDNWGSPFNVRSALAEDLMREILSGFQNEVALFATELD